MRQKWGQNFLADEKIARRIVDELRIKPEDAVLEIGPGKGVLTRLLIGKVQKIDAVEMDRDLAGRLSARWAGVPGFTVHNQDFLDWALPDWPSGSVKVLSNLPYSASGAILRRLLDWPSWTLAVVMVQKEVADRIVAVHGGTDYGILTLAVQSKAQVERLFDAPPGAYRPAPKVVSTVLRLAHRPQSLLRQEGPFFQVVRAAFAQRRKTIQNSLSHGLDLEKPLVETRLKSTGIDPSRRAETLSLEDFNRLTEAIFPENITFLGERPRKE
ncbi:MAG: ribosomal RNA small subunit methyltransferase A [Elusimicrobia bacterium]|nr:ribosomal RNA small subunit methyltransferase A [Elusimicrobiota bacterium]